MAGGEPETLPASRRTLGRVAGPLFAALLMAGLAACASLENNGLGLAPSASSVPVAPTDPKEAALGAAEHPKVLAAFGGAYESDRLKAYLGDVTETLRRGTGEPEPLYRVTVLNSPTINAFSLPGGYIYVTRGLVALANDEAEIAAVLAHEMAHIKARHALAREEQAISAAIISQVVSDVARDRGAGDAALALGRGRLAQFSREQELQADQVGIEMMAKAGYDPRAAVTFLTALDRQTVLHSRLTNRATDSSRVDMFATHPSTPERIAMAERLARELVPADGGARTPDTHLAAIDGMLYGDDPAEGFVRGRSYIHPGLGVTFSLPEGYGLENTPNAVIGFSSSGDIIRFDGISVDSQTPLADYLRVSGIRGGRVGTIAETTIAGRPGAIGTAEADDWKFLIALVRGQRDTAYRFILAAKVIDAAKETAFVDAVGSFRFISPAEAQAVRPYRLRIARVAPGESEATLARRMAFADSPLERFLALNGLTAGRTLMSGDQVKLVVE